MKRKKYHCGIGGKEGRSSPGTISAYVLVETADSSSRKSSAAAQWFGDWSSETGMDSSKESTVPIPTSNSNNIYGFSGDEKTKNVQ